MVCLSVLATALSLEYHQSLTQSIADSDSDDSIAQPTNRGNKLKRKAANVREGRLDTTGGRSYKKVHFDGPDDTSNNADRRACRRSTMLATAGTYSSRILSGSTTMAMSSMKKTVMRNTDHPPTTTLGARPDLRVRRYTSSLLAD